VEDAEPSAVFDLELGTLELGTSLKELPMPARPALLAVVFALGLLPVAGCGPAKLNATAKYAMDGGDARILDLPSISKAQKVTVEFNSSAGDVSVYLIKDFKERDGLDAAPNGAQILDKKQAKEGSFTVDVPEKTATRVVVRASSTKTDVTLKVT